MDCLTCRTSLSAELDGEADDTERHAAHEHLASCADCAAFHGHLVAFTRTTRVRSAEPVPDLSAAILARVPGAPATVRVRVWAQYGLVVVAMTQLVLSLPELVPSAGDGLPIHLEHHLGAWDVAMAIGLLVVAWQPERARGLLPMALALGGILLVTGAMDIARGDTVALTEAPHVLELAGIAFLWFLTRSPRRSAWPVSPTPTLSPSPTRQ